jgi:hypothetical protein
MKAKYLLGISIILVLIVFIAIHNRNDNFQNMNYTCPPGWVQTAKDSENGSCKVTDCVPGNNSPNSFDYGPLATPRGFPLNRRSARDYCIDSSHSNRTGDFDTPRSDTVDGKPIINPPDTPGIKNSRSGVGWNL